MSKAKATETIREYAKSEDLKLWYTKHAKEQMMDRDLYIGDVLHVLKYGFVHNEPKPATREGLFRYETECSAPNSTGREVRLIVIPRPDREEIKIVSVMWVDEPRHQS